MLAKHYNYSRDFDPALGRYIESDPIGVMMGPNTYAYVDSSPNGFVDPLGLAKCTYSITRHIMSCTSNDGSKTLRVGPGGVWSGQYSCQDNPRKECLEKEKIGPIPPGNYKMNQDDRKGHDRYWRLEPQPQTPGWKCRFGFARCGFMFHPGSVSWGCITADSRDADLMERYTNLHSMLLTEDGTNNLTVEP